MRFYKKTKKALGGLLGLFGSFVAVFFFLPLVLSLKIKLEVREVVQISDFRENGESDTSGRCSSLQLSIDRLSSRVL